MYRAAPHDVSLRWTEDYLSLWRDAGFGWAMWGLYGDFGILDSGRTDVVYEDFRGHKLDRALLGSLDEWWALVAVPAASAVAFCGSWWVTTAAGD